MARVILDSSNRVFLDVEWDWSRVLPDDDGARPNHTRAIVVGGRSLREYSYPLNEEIRRRGGVVIEETSDLETWLRRQYKITSADQSAITLNQPVEDRIAGRFEAARRKHDISQWSLEDYHQKLFFDDLRFRDFAKLQGATDQVVAAFDGKLVSYNHHSSHLSYFRVLLPVIIKSCKASHWIIIATDRVDENAIFEATTRDYLERSNLVEVICKMARLDASSIEAIIEGERHNRSLMRIPVKNMTYQEFGQALSEYRAIVFEKIEQYLPDVPDPSSAPIEFEVSEGRIKVSHNPVEAKLSSRAIDSVVQELIEQVDDVSRHFGIHNSAPACHAKLARVREHLVEMIQDGLSESRIITLGIRAQACRDHLAFESDNLDRPAEGAIHTALAQVELFLARFSEWREYAQGGMGEDLIRDGNLSAAVGVLQAFSNSHEIVDDSARFALNRAIYEASRVASTPSEKRGILRIVHNLASRVFSFVKEEIVANAKEAVKNALTFGLIGIIRACEPLLDQLAASHPGLFGWAPHIAAWVRTNISE